MKYRYRLLMFFPLFIAVGTYAQQQNHIPVKHVDTSLILFKNPGVILLRLSVFDIDQEDYDKCNAVLTLTKRDGDRLVECFRDSLYVWRPSLKLNDFNGDNVKDVNFKHHMSIGNSNEAYSLYLVDSKRKTLVRVKRFEEIYNPEFIKRRTLVKSWALSGNSIWWSYYKIDGRGTLHKVSRDYEERAFSK